MVLSVDTDSVLVFVDGLAVTEFGFQTDGRGGETWQNSPDNLAYPNGPASLSDSLGRFPVGATYKDDDDYFVPVFLEAGQHIFHAVDTYGDGWQGGWFELLDSSGAVVIGGQEDGAPEDSGADYAFTASEDASFTVHIRTGRWASEYQWSIDEGQTRREDVDGSTCGGVVCDGAGDGPCSCDPCPECYTGYSGPPPVHAIVVADGGRTGFYGSINTMALHRSSLSADEASCLYEFGKSWVALCPDPSRDWSTAWLVSGAPPSISGVCAARVPN